MSVLADRWASGAHIGSAAPTGWARIRTGRFNRRYDTWPGAAVGATIHNPSNPQSNTDPWQAFWEPDGDGSWTDLPNVLSIDRGSSFGNNGLPNATLVIENIVSVAQTEGHHTFHRGHLSPLRGYVAAGLLDENGDVVTPLIDEHGDEVAENDWFEKLIKNAQVEVFEGYGDEAERVFVGFIDDADTTSRPDRITITARMGKPLSEERVFGWNKDPDIKGPVTFIDDAQADDVKQMAKTPVASTSYDASHEPENVSDGDSATAWWSTDHATAANTEYVEVSLDEGRYSDYGLTTYFDQMEVYVSVYATALEDGTDPQVYDDVTDTWVDLTPAAWHDPSLGTVPGAHGGVPYVVHVTGIDKDVHLIRSLGSMYRLGDGSKVRLSFRSLGGDPVFRAGVRTFYARRRTLSEAAKTERWVRVDDVSDVIRVVLRWAGFKEWEVEDTGIKLSKRIVASAGMTYMDVIKKCQEAVGNFVFFVKKPSASDLSLGVPVWRYNRTATDALPVATVTDLDLLTAIDTKFTEAPLSYIIRWRGRESASGQTLGASPARRVMYEYRPPWAERVSPTEADRLAGFIKHFIKTNPMLTSVSECRMACLATALQMALESMKGTLQIPANPELELDEHVLLKDLGTGLVTRVWVAEWRTTLTLGRKVTYVETLGGSFIDTPDVQGVLDDINETVSI